MPKGGDIVPKTTKKDPEEAELTPANEEPPAPEPMQPPQDELKVEALKTLDVENTADLKRKVSDVKIFGNPDSFQLLCKASSESRGWMKSTKVCNVSGGCIVQTETQQRNPDGSYALSQALVFVPGNQIDVSYGPPVLDRLQG